MDSQNPLFYWQNYQGPHRIMGVLPAMKLFIEAYQEIPSTFEWTSDNAKYFHLPSIEKIFTARKQEGKQDLSARYYDITKKTHYINERYCDLGNGLAIYIQGGTCRDELESAFNILPDVDNKYFCADEVYILYKKGAWELVEELIPEFLTTNLTVKVASTLNMVCKETNDYYLYPFEIKKPSINLSLNYGEVFVPVHDKILTALSQKDKQGVVLLHGLPGSGKTHYIRYLINTIKDKELIYVPPDMAHALSSPDFLPFLMRHANAVLIIEDAENIIRDRQYQDNQAVANLLNLSDGLLGDCLNLQIIATFNSDITRIDSALLRKGRLIADWKFDKLPIEQAQVLSDSLGFKTTIDRAMTLADVYGQEDTNTGPNPNAEPKKIGF